MTPFNIEPYGKRLKNVGNPEVAYTYYVGRFGHNISVGFPLMPETSLR